MPEWNAGWSLLALLGVPALTAVVFGLPPQSVGDEQPDGEQVAKELLEYKANVDTLSGTVNVTYEDGDGTEYYRVEVTDRPSDPNHRAEIVESSFHGVNETVFVSNGSVAWSYDVETGEVTRWELADGFVYPHVDIPHDESTLEALQVEYVRTETVAGREAHLVRLSPPADAESIACGGS